MAVNQENPYDIHFYYSPGSEKAALEVRDQLKAQFGWLRFEEPEGKPSAPHTLPNWEADFKNSPNHHQNFGEVLRWLMLNRRGHSVIVHPHTGNELKDHTDYALWLGEKVPLDLSSLK
uniref:Putative 21. protein n=1 Tax=Anthurium amnicola TaxID=1678845 RepID=A0A1D1Y9E9_9ARAE